MSYQCKSITISIALIFLTVVILVPFGIGDGNDAENLEVELVRRESSPIEMNSPNPVAILINSEMTPIDFNHSSHGLATLVNPVIPRSIYQVPRLTLPPTTSMVAIGTRLYFEASDGVHGRELWVYDTSNGSTWMASDTYPGLLAGRAEHLTVVGTRLFFSAKNETNMFSAKGIELWAHETTDGSTWLVKDIYPGTDNSSPRDLTPFGTNMLFFSAKTHGSFRDLWVHNMYNNSTWQINLDFQDWPRYIHQLGDKLYFDAGWQYEDHELWIYNPVNNSLWELADIRPSTCLCATPSPSGYTLGSNPQGITSVGTRLYFTALGDVEGQDPPIHTGRALWAYETTNETHWLVVAIPSGELFGTGMGPETGGIDEDENGITVVGTRLFFEANDGVSGIELWTHETMNDSTWQVADINPTSGCAWNQDDCDGGAAHIIQVADTIYFEANNGMCGRELWAHDMTTNATWQVTDINPGIGDGHASGMTLIGDQLFFAADDGVNGLELWSLDTTLNSSVSCGSQYWEIEPDLPAGLMFNSTTGTISGTPTETTWPTLYTIWANSSIDSYSTTIQLSVLGTLSDVCENDDVWFSEIHAEGEPNDWIEFQHNASIACSLLGWKLYNQGIVDANGADDNQILTFGYVELDHVTSGGSVVWGIRDDNIASFTFEFDISSSGDTLYLESPDGSTVHEVVIASWTMGDGSWQNCWNLLGQASWDWTSNTHSTSRGNFNDCSPLYVAEEDSQGLPGFPLTICLLSMLGAAFFSERPRVERNVFRKQV